MDSDRKSFAQRHLDPGDRLAEMLCGLIMVLTFTLGAGLTVTQGPDAALSLLYAAIGCNLAWGIIDGVLYVLTGMSRRSERVRFIRAVHDAPDEAAAFTVVRTKVDERIAALATPEALAVFSREVLTHLRKPDAARSAIEQTRSGRVTASDLKGALAVFWLELLACVPAVVPFVIFRHDHLFALRVSNGVLVMMLFVVGWLWARYAALNRWLVGLVMAGLGLALVVVAMLLGG